LESQIKIKNDIIWEIKQNFKDDDRINSILQKSEEKITKSIKDNKGNKGQGLKNIADDIESRLRLEIEKLTFNYN
jgi:hypothetical protein